MKRYLIGVIVVLFASLGLAACSDPGTPIPNDDGCQGDECAAQQDDGNLEQPLPDNQAPEGNIFGEPIPDNQAPEGNIFGEPTSPNDPIEDLQEPDGVDLSEAPETTPDVPEVPETPETPNSTVVPIMTEINDAACGGNAACELCLAIFLGSRCLGFPTEYVYTNCIFAEAANKLFKKGYKYVSALSDEIYYDPTIFEGINLGNDYAGYLITPDQLESHVEINLDEGNNMCELFKVLNCFAIPK